MSALAELDAAPLTIEPTVNYIVNDGTKLINYVGMPGLEQTKSSGTPDPHKVVMHNGRLHLHEFKLDVDGFRFVHHDTKVQNFFDEAELRRVYYPEMEALVVCACTGAGPARQRTPATGFLLLSAVFNISEGEVY